MKNQSTWAVVPVKSLGQAKSRLSKLLDNNARQNLVVAMFEDLLTTLDRVVQIDRVLVVTCDDDIAEIAETYGAVVLRESVDSGLNSAIAKAVTYLQRQHISRMLVLPADIPLVSPVDIQTIVDADKNEQLPPSAPILALVAAGYSGGTNALLVSPPNLIEFRYGKDSYQYHLEQGQELGINVLSPVLLQVALDIDTPRDLEILWLDHRKLRPDSRTRRWLKSNLPDAITEQLTDASLPNEIPTT